MPLRRGRFYGVGSFSLVLSYSWMVGVTSVSPLGVFWPFRGFRRHVVVLGRGLGPVDPIDHWGEGRSIPLDDTYQTHSCEAGATCLPASSRATSVTDTPPAGPQRPSSGLCGRFMQNPENGLRRILLPRTPVNKARRRAGAPRFGDSGLGIAPLLIREDAL